MEIREIRVSTKRTMMLEGLDTVTKETELVVLIHPGDDPVQVQQWVNQQTDNMVHQSLSKYHTEYYQRRQKSS